MTRIIKIERIERLMNSSGSWKIVAFNELGITQVFGNEMTERGSKMMLTKRANQFNLKVNGNVAE